MDQKCNDTTEIVKWTLQTVPTKYLHFLNLLPREQIRSVRKDPQHSEGLDEGDEVYSLENILQDLLNFSADRLRVGGRLVYWIPIIRQVYKVHIEWEVLSTGFGTFLSFAPKKRSILPYKPA